MASLLTNDFQYEKSGDINTVYSFFYTYNFTNTQSTSSYALPFAGFTFIPRLEDVSNNISRKRIVWDFGDNTLVESVTARHAYRLPGRYKVTCYLYDRDGNSYFDSFTQTVDVYNYVPDYITLSGNYDSNTYLTCGKYTNPISITRYTSYQAYERGIPQLIITPYASGGVVTNYDYFDSGISNNHYSHLYPYASFYLQLTSSNNITEFAEIASFETTSIPIYCRLSSTQIVNCTKNDPGAFFCGTSGVRDVYFKSDIPANTINLVFGFQPNTINFFNNTTTVGLSTRILDNIDYNRLSITSNGMDTEGTTTASFPINKNKFSNTDISFVVRVKDSNNFIIKNIPVLSNIQLELTNGVQVFPAIFTNLTNELSSTTGGFYKGTCRVNTTSTLSSVFISASVSINGTTITGISNTFNIYPKEGVYNIAKKGEDIDFVQKFKDISFQSLFVNQKTLYNQYLNGVFGTLSSEQTTVGKTTYEKIKNFVSNNSISDYANISKLVPIFKEYNVTCKEFSKYNFRFPSKISRLMDVLSINRCRLFGTQNKFSENFNSYGYLNNDIYGYNLGEEITIHTPLSAGEDIVAFEKFSGIYTRLNTYQPTKAFEPGIVTYYILSYTPVWGWNLVLPPDGYGEKISSYYSFYRYIPKIDGTIENGIINFSDPNTTLQYTNSSYKEWSEKDGIIANILTNELYKGLNLIK